MISILMLLLKHIFICLFVFDQNLTRNWKSQTHGTFLNFLVLNYFITIGNVYL